MNILKKSSGITLVALIITIIVLMIIAGISITQGTKLIDKTKAETIETNMLTIKAKAKEYAEEVDAKTWNLSGTEKENKNQTEFTNTYKLIKIDDISIYENSASWYNDGFTYYALNKEALDNMGLSDLWENDVKYVVKCKDLEVDIIYIDGITYDGTTYYALSELQEKL